MRGAAKLARRFRALVALIVVALAAPLLVGPAYGATLRALGGEAEHKCACGMKRGTCGCPECERLEQVRADDAGRAVLSSNCNTDETPLPTTPAVPAVLPRVIAAASFVAPRGVFVERAAPQAHPRPPTPPPRNAS